MKTRVYNVKRINLSKITDKHGNLSVIEENKEIPFEIKRTYWIYDVPSGQSRGGHVFKENEELVIALSGSFDLVFKDGMNETVVQLNRPNQGAYIPAGIWGELQNFSTNAQVLVLASTHYNQEDYVWDFSQLKGGLL